MKRALFILSLALLALLHSDSATAGFPIITFGGDLTGTYASQTVLKVNGVSVPASPTANTVLVATGASAATWQSPQVQNSVVATFPYANLQTHRAKWFSGETAAYNSTTPSTSVYGFAGITWNNVTTTLLPNPAGTLLQATKRLRFQATTTTVYIGWNETGYVNAGITQSGVYRGAAANRGGFFFRTRFAVSSVGNSSTLRGFFGLLDAVAQQTLATNYFTDTAAAKLGVGFDFTTTAVGAIPANNWKFIESDHNAPNLTDTGIPVALNDFVELVLFSAQNSSQVIAQLNNLTTAATFTATLNTQLPATTRLLAPQCTYVVNAIVSGTNALDVSLAYLEDFNG